MDYKETLFDVLDEHLNDGCIDSRCWYEVRDEGADTEVHFPDEFIEHLAECVTEALDC